MTAKKKMAVKTKSKKKPTQQPVAITLVPNDLTSAPGQLGTPDVAVVHRRVTDRLAKAKLQLGVGVLEVNLVEHQDGRYPTAWAWHLHGLAFTRKPEALAKRLGKAFPRTDVVPRPVRVTPWDGSSKWPRYCYKLDTRCRIGVDDATHFDVRKQEPREFSRNDDAQTHLAGIPGTAGVPRRHQPGQPHSDQRRTNTLDERRGPCGQIAASEALTVETGADFAEGS